MTERVVAITGGARGIGRAIGLALAEKGWSIGLCYRTSAQDAATALAEIQERGGQGLALQIDISDAEAAQGFARQVEGRFGRIDALIHCAGPYHRINILEETVEGWNEMFDNNLHPLFYLSKAVVPGMKARGWGRILSFSMANADQIVAQPYITGHYISKVGLLVLTRSLARVLAPHGITVNTISPGFIDSGSEPAEELQKVVRRIPAGYIGHLNDAVQVALFLLSDEARYVNGANIHLSGAWGI
jgi:3-oxoacyl-[acyl-carrier protein] reductase